MRALETIGLSLVVIAFTVALLLFMMGGPVYGRGWSGWGIDRGSGHKDGDEEKESHEEKGEGRGEAKGGKKDRAKHRRKDGRRAGRKGDHRDDQD